MLIEQAEKDELRLLAYALTQPNGCGSAEPPSWAKAIRMLHAIKDGDPDLLAGVIEHLQTMHPGLFADLDEKFLHPTD